MIGKFTSQQSLLEFGRRAVAVVASTIGIPMKRQLGRRLQPLIFLLVTSLLLSQMPGTSGCMQKGKCACLL